MASEHRAQDDVKLSAEWCELMAAAHSNSRFIGHRTEDAKYAKALRIASRVLDEGAEERLRAIITRAMVGGASSVPTSTDREAARAVLAHIRGAG
jgi:hypothetical protein